MTTNLREEDWVRLHFGESPIFPNIGLLSHFSSCGEYALILWIDSGECTWESVHNLILWEGQ